MDCLNNIIGLTETECECFEAGAPETPSESASGVFLDQLEGFNLKVVQSGDDCARGGLWDRMARAVENAKADLKTNLLSCVGQTYKPRIDPLSVQLGSPTFTGSLNLTTAYAGVKLRPIQIKGGFMYLKRIGILVNASVPVVFKVYSNIDGGTLLYTSTTVNATANVLTWAEPTVPIALPMYSYQVDVKYYVLLVLDGTFQPKANNRDCGCGGVQRPYLRYMDFEGIKGDDVNNVDGFTSTKEVNGLVLDVEFKCKMSEIICSDERPLDFNEDSDSLGMAYAIRFRAAARLYEEVLSSTNINRETLMNREELANYVKGWNLEYTNWINYICGNINLGTNGCYICKAQNTTLIKNTILATR